MIFTAVATKLREEYSGIFVSGESVPIPPSFPAVTIIEMDNSFYTRTMDLAGNENHSSVMYEINAYSNLTSGKKAQCKSIMATIDKEMHSIGFVRMSRQPLEVPNADGTKYRMVSRYRAVISKKGETHRIR